MYVSTRGNSDLVSASQGIAMGMVPGGGLFVPSVLPKLTIAQMQSMVGQPYQRVAEWILGYYLDDYTKDEIAECVAGAYSKENFPKEDIAPLVKIGEGLYILELWHGPTAAFKDMALQLTPRLLVKAIEKDQSAKEVVILVATSGDTGKAALEGFKNIPGTKIIVFYPVDGVSKVQELQMVTTDGDNTFVVAVDGNFDDCQSGVKEIFADQELIKLLDQGGYQFSSANSINWGRLLPQIVYYFTSYFNLVRDQGISFGDQVNYVVPTGNFGNILAAWYAKNMGLPIGKLICASNENKVLTDFFATGVYNKNRDFVQTNSPSMDILISSNLERFLYGVTGADGPKIAGWMEVLKHTGEFKVDEVTKRKMDEFVVSGYANQEETLQEIKACFGEREYLLDTHTAVALKVYEDYRLSSGDERVTVIDSTANPYKFVASVYGALTSESVLKEDELDLLDKVEALTGVAVHRGLVGLGNKQVMHKMHCAGDKLAESVRSILGL